MSRFKSAVLVSLPTVALAAINFVSASAAQSGNNFVWSWHEAGLGDNQNVTYDLRVVATITSACVNKGGNTVEGVPFTAPPVTVTETPTFNSGKHGNISKTVTFVPHPSPSLNCKGNSTAKVTSASYSNALLEDETNEIIGAGSEAAEE